MKKTIVALTVALSSLAASAQISINGVVGYGVTVTDGNSTFGVHDSKVVVTATEKIGDLTATGVVGVNGLARGKTADGQDAYVALAGKFGEVKAGQVELANGIMGRGNAGAPVIGTDGVVLAGVANKQLVSYTTPGLAGFKGSVSATQDISGVGARSYSVGATYDQGPLSAGVDFKEDSKRVRTSASYDLNVVKLGAGWSFNETGVANSYTMGVSAPVGPLLVGAVYSKGNGDAVEAGAAYSLSKRTVLSVAYRNVNDSTVLANNVDSYRVRLTHNF